jgi:hypothetical protein
MSMDDYESIEKLKLRLLQSRAIQAKIDIETGNAVDGGSFFEALESGQHD